MRHMGGNYVRRLLVMLKLVKMTRVISGGSDRGRDSRHLYRSEEHTSELQSPDQLVCRLLLEKKNYDDYATKNDLCVTYVIIKPHAERAKNWGDQPPDLVARDEDSIGITIRGAKMLGTSSIIA